MTTDAREAGRSAQPRTLSLRLQHLFVRLGVLPFLLIIAIIVFSLLSSRFLGGQNLINVARQSTYLTMVAMGQMLALTAVLILFAVWRSRPGFLQHAFLTNSALMTVGFVLTGHQIAGYLVSP